MIALLKLIWQRSQREDGVIALMTFLFLTTVGFLALFLVWMMAYTSGAYTTLYDAAQGAAYAAASDVDFTTSSTTSQPPFDCQAGFDSTAPGSGIDCTGGRTFAVAQSLLEAELNAGNQGNRYGLSYPGNVQLLNENGLPIDGILAYEVAAPAGAAHAADPNCSGNAVLNTDPGSPSAPLRSCWINPAVNAGVADFNYDSGIVVIAQAQITLPLCPRILGGLCTRTIKVAVPARIGQQQNFLGSNTP